MYYLTLGSCLKNEEEYIIPFILLHRFLGVEHFIFFDRTYEPLNSLLNKQDFPDVDIIHFPEGVNDNVHAKAWGELIGRCRGITKWLALIDADECLVPQQTTDIRQILKNYENYASLQINWKIFGSGGQEKKGPEPIYERFIKCSTSLEGVNNHTQFICQPDRTLPLKTNDPHHPKLPPGEVSVNTNKVQVNGPFNIPPLHDILWCAHYITKSKEEWDAKNQKGRADIFGAKMPYDHFADHNRIGNVEEEYRVLELWNQAKSFSSK